MLLNMILVGCTNDSALTEKPLLILENETRAIFARPIEHYKKDFYGDGYLYPYTTYVYYVFMCQGANEGVDDEVLYMHFERTYNDITKELYHVANPKETQFGTYVYSSQSNNYKLFPEKLLYEECNVKVVDKNTCLEILINKEGKETQSYYKRVIPSSSYTPIFY